MGSIKVTLFLFCKNKCCFSHKRYQLETHKSILKYHISLRWGNVCFHFSYQSFQDINHLFLAQCNECCYFCIPQHRIYSTVTLFLLCKNICFLPKKNISQKLIKTFKKYYIIKKYYSCVLQFMLLTYTYFSTGFTLKS